jgi:hypothetical protein
MRGTSAERSESAKDISDPGQWVTDHLLPEHGRWCSGHRLGNGVSDRVSNLLGAGEDELVVEEVRGSPTLLLSMSRPRAGLGWPSSLRSSGAERCEQRENRAIGRPHPRQRAVVAREQCPCVSRVPLPGRARFQRLRPDVARWRSNRRRPRARGQGDRQCRCSFP